MVVTDKLLIIGDIQAKKSNLELVKQLLEDVENHKLSTIFLGDMLDKRGLIEAEVLNVYYNYFKNSKLQHHIIVGNHDLISMHSTESALEPLKALNNVKIVDKPTLVLGSAMILLMPYYRDPNKFLSDLRAHKKFNTRYLFCHQGVKEFTLGSGYTESEAVNLEDLKDLGMVIAGHYHTPMEKGNVIYLGSPFSHSFGESNEIKRLAIFDESYGGKLEFIKTNFPKHISYEVDCSKFQPEDTLAVSGANHYRVFLKGTAEEIAKFDQGKYFGVKFIEQPSSKKFESKIQESQTHAQMFTNWLNDLKNSANKEELEELGLKILEDSK